MDMGGAMGELNWLVVLLATVVPFVLGAVWYGPLLGKRWMAGAGMTEEKVAQANMGRTFGVAFLLQAVQVVVLAIFIGSDAGLAVGLLAGVLVGAAWVATAFGGVYLFEQRPLDHFLVNAGYMVVSFSVMGAVLGLLG